MDGKSRVDEGIAALTTCISDLAEQAKRVRELADRAEAALDAHDEITSVEHLGIF